MYFNMCALRICDVGTILIARACCPLCVCVLEFLFLGRHLPSRRSTIALFVVAASAVGHVLVTRHSSMALGRHAYTLVACYYVLVCAADTYGKWIVTGLDWSSPWGPVLYSNSLGIPHQLLIAFASGEAAALGTVEWRPIPILVLGLTCVLGVSISYFSWSTRALVSATSFTLLGIANKLLSVAGAALIWEPPSVLSATLLVTCLVGAACYKQPPLRSSESTLLDKTDESEGAKGRVRAAVLPLAGLIIGVAAAGLLSGIVVAAGPRPQPQGRAAHTGAQHMQAASTSGMTQKPATPTAHAPHAAVASHPEVGTLKGQAQADSRPNSKGSEHPFIGGLQERNTNTSSLVHGASAAAHKPRDEVNARAGSGKARRRS
eukprot:719545-Prymnesium_polylepis.2